MKKLNSQIYPDNFSNYFPTGQIKKAGILAFLICLCLFISGCIQIPSLFETRSDSSFNSNSYENQPVPDAKTEPKVNHDMIITPVTEPTSYVMQLPDTKSPDYFIPSRNSVYFQNNIAEKPEEIYQIYTESGILLNSTIKEREIHVEEGPFSIKFTIHPENESPLISWAHITVSDPFGTILKEDGYNRHFSSDDEKEFLLYRSGVFIVRIEGGYATLDLSINTADEAVVMPSPTHTSRKEIPPEILMRMQRNG